MLLLGALWLYARFVKRNNERDLWLYAGLAPVGIAWHYGLAIPFGAVAVLHALVLIGRRSSLNDWLKGTLAQLPWASLSVFLLCFLSLLWR